MLTGSRIQLQKLSEDIRRKYINPISHEVSTRKQVIVKRLRKKFRERRAEANDFKDIIEETKEEIEKLKNLKS